MKGLEAINYYNGWGMAITGALIVFSGLLILSFIISRIKHLIAFLERKPAAKTKEASCDLPTHLPLDPYLAAPFFRKIIQEFDSPFPLTLLYEKSRAAGLAHPHLSISALRREGFLKPAADGMYTWHEK